MLKNSRQDITNEISVVIDPHQERHLDTYNEIE